MKIKRLSFWVAACLATVFTFWPDVAPAPIIMWDVNAPVEIDRPLADHYKPNFMVYAFNNENGLPLNNFTVSVMHSGTKKVLENTSTEMRNIHFQRELGQAVAYANVKTGQYHIWVKKKGYETVQRNFWIRSDSSETIKVYLKPVALKAPLPEPQPTTPVQREPIYIQGKDMEPKVVSIKGWGRDLSDGSGVCFFSDFPNLKMSDDPRRCATKDKRANAQWAGYYKFLDRKRLVLMVRNLSAPSVPRNRLAIGYTVRIKNATFSDGKTKKTFTMIQFSGKPRDISANKVIDLVLKPGAGK